MEAVGNPLSVMQERLLFPHQPLRCCNDETEQNAPHDLQRRVTQHLAQVFFTEDVPAQEFVEEHVDALGMDACLPAHARRVVHDDHRDRHAQRKDRAVEAVIQPDAEHGRRHQRGMRAWHAARGEKQRPIPTARTEIIQRDLDDLRQQPCSQSSDQRLVIEQCNQIIQTLPQNPLRRHRPPASL